MFITVITDCHDANATSRQGTRWSGYFNITPTLVGVDNYNEYEAGAYLIDVLDAAAGNEGIVFANVAPRHGKGKKWPNGTPFGYFFYENTMVISTIDGYNLSLIKKLGLTDNIKVWDIPTVMDKVISEGVIEEVFRDHISKSQFRSYEFVPRAAHWHWNKKLDLPTDDYAISEVADMPKVITFPDNFGNCPTSILPEEIGFEPGKTLTTKLGDIKCYERLKDVPNGEPALIIGSWGIREKRFVALVVQGKSAKDHFHIEPGTELF